jgi:hypothetical protein
VSLLFGLRLIPCKYFAIARITLLRLHAHSVQLLVPE